MHRSSVDFPQPDGPRMAMNSFSFTWIVMSSSALAMPKCLDRLVMCSSVIGSIPPFKVIADQDDRENKERQQNGIGLGDVVVAAGLQKLLL